MGKLYPEYTLSFHTQTYCCHPDVAMSVALVKTIMTSEMDVLNLPIHKHRHKTPKHWLSPCFDSQHITCVCFNLVFHIVADK